MRGAAHDLLRLGCPNAGSVGIVETVEVGSDKAKLRSALGAGEWPSASAVTAIFGSWGAARAASHAINAGVDERASSVGRRVVPGSASNRRASAIGSRSTRIAFR